MSYCGHCGTQLEPDAAFCAACGQPVEAAAASAEASSETRRRPAPPAAPPAVPPGAPIGAPTTPPPGGQFGRQPGTPPPYARGAQQIQQMPGWAKRVLVGNWVGSAAVAAAIVGTAVVFAAILVLIGHQSGMGVRDTLTAITALATGAFGADVGGDASGASVHLGVFPLTITFAAVAAGVFAFRRVTAGYTRSVDGVIDAVRTALIAALLTMVLALVFTTKSDGGKLGSSGAGAFFLTLLIVAAVLAVTVLMRRDWLHSKVAQVVHDWAKAPIIGLVAFLLFLPVAGIVAALAVLLFGSGTGDVTAGFTGADWRLLSVGVVAFAGNLGMGAVTLGSYGKVGLFGLDDFIGMIKGVADQLGGDVSIPKAVTSGVRLRWFTGDYHEPGLWVCVVLAPLCLGLAAYAVVRASGHRAKGGPAARVALRSLALWVVSLLVAVPYFVRLANVHVNVDVSQYGLHLHPVVGASGVGATFLLFLYGLVVAFVVALAAGVLDGPTLRASVAAIGKQLQQTPGQQQGYPPQGQSGYPPPGYQQPAQQPGYPPQQPPSYAPPTAPPAPPGPPPAPPTDTP